MKLVSVEEAARRLHISARRVRQLCQDGRLGQKVGSQYVITETELLKFSAMDRPAHRPAKGQ